AVPALKTTWAGVDASILPTSKSARVVSDAVTTDFPNLPFNTQVVAIQAPRNAADEVAAYAARVERAPGVEGVAPPRPLADGLWQLDVHGSGPGMDEAAMRMVAAVRAVDAPFPALVGGGAANQYDQQAAI